MSSLWDERIKLDPLLWMTEVFSDSTDFWVSGERDLGLLLEILSTPLTGQARVLDLGCGVGRLIGPALSRGWFVVGVDGSEAAIGVATKRYANTTALSLVQSLLPAIPSNLGSFDLLISFAALPHLTPEALVSTLLQIPNLLKPQGRALLHLYLGDEHIFSADDDFSIRSYRQASLRLALKLAALEIRAEQQLKLPFPIHDAVLKRFPWIFEVSASNQPQSNATTILQALVAQQEEQFLGQTSVDAYRVLVTKMNQLIANRDFVSLRDYLTFARRAHPEQESEWQRLSQMLTQST